MKAQTAITIPVAADLTYKPTLNMTKLAYEMQVPSPIGTPSIGSNTEPRRSIDMAFMDQRITLRLLPRHFALKGRMCFFNE